MSTREVRTKNGKKRISQEVKMEIVREYYLEGHHSQEVKEKGSAVLFVEKLMLCHTLKGLSNG